MKKGLIGKKIGMTQIFDNTGKVILKDHLRHSLVDAVADGDYEATENVCKVIDRFM